MIYANICKIAQRKGMSINKLEQEAGVSSGSICKWGKNISPTIKNLKKVADVLQCSVEELIQNLDKTEKEVG